MNTFFELNGSYETELLAEYGDNYYNLKWPDQKTALAFLAKKEALLEKLRSLAKWGLKDTKVDITNLSHGCKLCTEGSWSCLFITGLCNGGCFYCPTNQNEKSIPSTNALQFKTPQDYAHYVQKLAFQGVSISGGEPFLDFNKTVEYIKAVREIVGEHIYIWIYTNGLLVTQEKLKVLKDLHVNEIRFDIGADNYSLKKAQMAISYIPVVTVEIPAIPDELIKLKELTFQMASIGIKHLNLHQLRITPHNFNQLIVKNYHYIRAEKAVSIESELTALELIVHVYENHINLPINYCSFIYKHRFQKAAARKKNALLVKENHESITENGYLRRIGIKDKISGKIQWPKSGFDFPLDKDCEYIVQYEQVFLRENPSYHLPFKKYAISDNKTAYLERSKVAEYVLDSHQIFQLFRNNPYWEENGPIQYEKIKPGMLDYTYIDP